MSENALTVTEGQFSVMLKQADTLVQSGFLPRAVDTPQKAVAILMMGQELQIGAWAALNGINVIQGKPTISPQLMLALIYKSGELEDIQIDRPEAIAEKKACDVMMKRRGLPAHTETFTMNMAAAMGLSGKDNWKKQAGVMLKWRAISACARVVFPDIIIGFYTPEEINPDLQVDEETGEIIEAELQGIPQLAPSNGGMPDTSNVDDLLDKLVNELDGTGVYRIKGYIMENSDITADKHYVNRMSDRFGTSNSAEVNETVETFVAYMVMTHEDWEAAIKEVAFGGEDG